MFESHRQYSSTSSKASIVQNFSITHASFRTNTLFCRSFRSVAQATSPCLLFQVPSLDRLFFRDQLVFKLKKRGSSSFQHLCMDDTINPLIYLAILSILPYQLLHIYVSGKLSLAHKCCTFWHNSNPRSFVRVSSPTGGAENRAFPLNSQPHEPHQLAQPSLTFPHGTVFCHPVFLHGTPRCPPAPVMPATPDLSPEFGPLAGYRNALSSDEPCFRLDRGWRDWE